MTEEVDLLNQQVEELTNLKKIAEQQLEEALESLQNEREQRHVLKKELDSKLNSDNMYQLGNLALSIQNAAGGNGDSSEATDADSAILDAAKKDTNADNDSDGPPSDLFSEIHGGELKKLEKRIESAESEKVQLSKSLVDSKSILEKAQSDIRSYQANLALLGTCLSALVQLHNEHKKLINEEKVEERKLTELSEKQIVKMQESVREMEVAHAGQLPEGLTKLKSEVTFLRRDAITNEQKSAELSHDLKILEKLSSESLRALGDTQLEMTAVQTELTKVYELVCKQNHQTPSKIMLMRTEKAKTSGTSALIGKFGFACDFYMK